MFYARLLYPTYYFDVFENIIDDEEDEKNLDKIVSKSHEYELFLKDVYIFLSKSYYMPEITWIIKS